MKTIYKIALILILAVSYTCTSQRPVAAQGEYISFQVFYDQLSPYGDWIDYPDYGYVWIPDVGPDFEPYATAGYWVMTDYGWTWVSDYPWGWAPFHYGRWDFDRRIGWFWIPGSEWGPAWVTWRRANGYYGWAPLRPGISVSMSFNLGYRDDDHWCFVRDRDFGRHDIYRYYVDRRDFGPIVRNSVVINNIYTDNRRHITYISGPNRDEIQRYTGRRINQVPVKNEISPGQTISGNQLRIYRPRVENLGNTGTRPAPSRLSNINNVKPREERNAASQRNVIIPQDNSRIYGEQSSPQRQFEHRVPESLPREANPQRRFEQQPPQQQNEQRQPGEMQRQGNAPQIQQNRQPTFWQRREMRRADRSQRRIQQQQAQPQQKQEQSSPQKQRENEGTDEPGRRR